METFGLSKLKFANEIKNYSKLEQRTRIIVNQNNQSVFAAETINIWRISLN